MKITENFSLEELYASNTALRRKIDNKPNDVQIHKLINLAKTILQPIRNKYGKPIRVTSGYRSPKLNKVIGGSKTSLHALCEAADIQDIHGNNAELFNCIKKMIENKELKVGQLIWEFGNDKNPAWVHVSMPYRKVNQILRIR